MSERNIPEQNSHEFTEFESQLARLTPHKSRIERETLLFRAGRESVLARPRQPSWTLWLWPLTTAAMTILSAGLGWQLYTRGERSVIERVKIVERSEAAPEAATPLELEHSDEPRSMVADTTYVRTTPPIPRDHYLRRRELALTVGMDAFTAPVAFRAREAADVSSYRELRSTYTESSSRGGEKKSEQESMSNSRFLGEQS